MKSLFLIAAVLMPLVAHADFGAEYSEGFKHINNPSFRSRFLLKGEIFIVDANGKKLLAPTTEVREWRLGPKADEIDAYWSTKAKGIRDVNVHLNWHLRDDNSLSVTTRQYEDFKYDRSHPKKTKLGKLIREEANLLENFEPISWVAETGKDYRVILRFTPEIDAIREGDSLEKIPIGGDRGTFEVTDNQGYLWSDNVRFGGILAGITSHRGSFVISFYPFKGAKEMGSAMGKSIELNLTEDLRVKIRSEGDVVPGDMKVKVYGKYLPNLKSGSINSTSSYGQMNLEGMPKEFW